MEYVHVPGVGPAVSRIVMGMDWVGARRFVYLAGRRFSSPFVNRRQDGANLDLLDGVYDAGCTAFDTARAYGDSERTLGAWLGARQVRERVAVITKGGHPGPGWKSRLSPAAITADLERSLRELRTDYVDIYLLHYDDPRTEVGPLVDVLSAHVASGKVRAAGVSNWATPRIADAMGHARRTGQHGLAVSSVQFSLATWRESPWPTARSLSGAEYKEDRAWYKASNLYILAYSSLAMGFFSSARSYARGAVATGAPARFGDRVFLTPENLARLERTRALAAQRQATPGQVALAWVLTHDPRVLPIVGARTAAAYAEAARALTLQLSPADRTWLADGGDHHVPGAEDTGT